MFLTFLRSRLAVMLLLLGVAGVAACGKKAPLDPVPGGTYPRSYPDSSSSS